MTTPYIAFTPDELHKICDVLERAMIGKSIHQSEASDIRFILRKIYHAQEENHEEELHAQKEFNEDPITNRLNSLRDILEKEIKNIQKEIASFKEERSQLEPTQGWSHPVGPTESP